MNARLLGNLGILGLLGTQCATVGARLATPGGGSNSTVPDVTLDARDELVSSTTTAISPSAVSDAQPNAPAVVRTEHSETGGLIVPRRSFPVGDSVDEKIGIVQLLQVTEYEVDGFTIYPFPKGTAPDGRIHGQTLVPKLPLLLPTRDRGPVSKTADLQAKMLQDTELQQSLVTIALLTVITMPGLAAASLALSSAAPHDVPTRSLTITTVPLPSSLLKSSNLPSDTTASITSESALPLRPARPTDCGVADCPFNNPASKSLYMSINGLYHARSCQNILASQGWVPWDCAMADVFNTTTASRDTGTGTGLAEALGIAGVTATATKEAAANVARFAPPYIPCWRAAVVVVCVAFVM